MTNIGAAFIRFVRLIVILACQTFPVAASAQDDKGVAMNAFFNAWMQAMKAGDKAQAEQLAREQKDIAEMVANRAGGQARAAFKANKKETALSLFTLTKTLFEHLDDKLGIAVVSNDLGVYYDSVGDCTSALPHFIRASALTRKLKLQDPRAAAALGIQVCVLKVAVQDPSVSAIANLKVSPDGTQQVVVYNREQCLQAGMEVCGFYLVHEYAHLVLRHATNDAPSERSESEADCWAAKEVSLEWARAAHAWFLEGASSPGVHVSSEMRADGIKRCAGL